MKIKRKKYLSHTYHYQVSGEDLPKVKKINRKVLFVTLFVGIAIFLLCNYFATSIYLLANSAVNAQRESTGILELFDFSIADSFKVSNFFVFILNKYVYIIFFIFSVFISLMLYIKLSYRFQENIVYGQKGDSRLTTIDEIQEQYKEIPEKGKQFPGLGGVPISHYKSKYYIDDTTVNNLIVGISRSGKGEIIINPMIDILSRAQEQSSMVVNDPKGELFSASKETLEKRGYEVQVLNIDDPLQSMSYNPLQFVTDAWIRGDTAEAAKRATSITYTLYNNPNVSENKFFYDGAQDAIAAIILTIVEHCVKNSCPEKITMHNVSEMLNQLGAHYYKKAEEDIFEKNALDEYFKGLPQGNVAKKNYGSTSFAGDRAKGDILSTANQGLKPFIDEPFAKMTSGNSINLKELGFPKYISGQFDSDTRNERVVVGFYRGKVLLKSYKVKIKNDGRYIMNFDVDLETGDYIQIRKDDGTKVIYQIRFEQEQKDSNGNITYKKEVKVIRRYSDFPQILSDLSMFYSNKPIALFMIIPDYDPSNHVLATIFIKQLYRELSQQCTQTAGKKCFRRVHFLLDEAGNLPAIDDLGTILSVCLGRNILFSLVIQSYAQINAKYGNEADQILDNCQIIYIASTNDETIEKISKIAGHKTIAANTSHEEALEIKNRLAKASDQVRIITPERLSQLIEGETLVIRPLKRRDNKGKKVRPYPIFNTKETNMPYRYEFLSNWMNTENDLNDIDIPSEHTDLRLSDLEIDFSVFIRDEKGREDYLNKYGPALKKVVNDAHSVLANQLKDYKNRLPKLSPHHIRIDKLLYEYEENGKFYDLDRTNAAVNKIKKLLVEQS